MLFGNQLCAGSLVAVVGGDENFKLAIISTTVSRFQVIYHLISAKIIINVSLDTILSIGSHKVCSNLHSVRMYHAY